MTEPDRTFEEEIRRALYAAGDLIVPAGDGLNKIRERAARRPPVLGWLLAYATHLPRRLVHGGRVAASEVTATMHGHSSLGLVRESARRWPDKARHVLRTPGIWMRPVLATATALILVIGVTLAIPRLRQQATAQLDSLIGNSSHHTHGGGGPSAGGGVGNPESSSSSQLRTKAAALMSGKPFLATMPPSSSQCRGQPTNGTSGTGVTDQAGGVFSSPPDIGPQPVSVTCPSSAPPAKRSTSPLVTSPSTMLYTSPPTTPVVTTSPTTTPPVTTPPVTTSPVTTPPTTTSPATTPPTTTSPATNTSSADSTESSEPTPTETPTPGG